MLRDAQRIANLLFCEEYHSYKIIYRRLSSRLRIGSMSLKRLVGPPGFEPGTSCTPIKVPFLMYPVVESWGKPQLQNRLQSIPASHGKLPYPVENIGRGGAI
jgi:hypothetical protein